MSPTCSLPTVEPFPYFFFLIRADTNSSITDGKSFFISSYSDGSVVCIVGDSVFEKVTEKERKVFSIDGKGGLR